MEYFADALALQNLKDSLKELGTFKDGLMDVGSFKNRLLAPQILGRTFKTFSHSFNAAVRLTATVKI